MQKRSKVQVHSFNIPFQMSKFPTDEQIEQKRQQGKVREIMTLRRMMRNNKESICSDSPSAAETYEIEVQAGDVIVTATDGVYDNLFFFEILDIIQKFKEERYKAKLAEQDCTRLRAPPCLLSTQAEAE